MNKEELLQDILTHFNITITQFNSNSRYKNIVRARQIYFYIQHRKGRSVCNIAKGFGFSHGNISHSIKVINNEIETNSDINKLVINLLEKYVA